MSWREALVKGGNSLNIFPKNFLSFFVSLKMQWSYDLKMVLFCKKAVKKFYIPFPAVICVIVNVKLVLELKIERVDFGNC